MREPTTGDTAPQASADPSAPQEQSRFFALTLGSIGVVYGDIGTSPLYALRESLRHLHGGGFDRPEVLGVVSLLIWALIVVVTLKYVLFLLRADNRGEGGTLSLLALVEGAMGRRTPFVFALAAAGAAMFFGDAIITPAISVLSAVEGLEVATPAVTPWVIPVTVLVLAVLFSVQASGTASVAAWFGPITAVWFVVLAVSGIVHLADDPGVLHALDPRFALRFLADARGLALIVLGSVFLAVTGAEALYADMGHFGRRPIRFAWLVVVFPALTVHYLGQGAFLLANPQAIDNPLFLMMPAWALVPMVVLATLATVIASQAVISGAYSLTRQAIRLGLLPRFEVRHTSETQRGQIYMPRINRMLFFGVVLLVVTFRTSSDLASAYGIAVTGSMIATSALAFFMLRHVWNWPWLGSLALVLPFIAIEAVFLVANLTKFVDGGWLPIGLAATMMVVMWTWSRGSAIVIDRIRRESVPLTDFVRMIGRSHPFRPEGTAVFLTLDPETAPTAALHNLKHNQVLHRHNLVLNVRTARTPYVSDEERLQIRPLSDDFTLVLVTFGYAETPDIPLALMLLRKEGFRYDIMKTTFFVGRRSFKTSTRSDMPAWQDRLFVRLAREASDATDFYRIPSGRVVELGQQIHV
ncbi:potassium transporter Kup [Pinisolibacter sp.]|uniref:potassium transporter Kup n=1 Tax=Pinisolibacter sp. TaxID=2172024 RepID=UPI002FDEC546